MEEVGKTEGLTFDETAAVLGINITVAHRLHTHSCLLYYRGLDKGGKFKTLLCRGQELRVSKMDNGALLIDNKPWVMDYGHALTKDSAQRTERWHRAWEELEMCPDRSKRRRASLGLKNPREGRLEYLIKDPHPPKLPHIPSPRPPPPNRSTNPDPQPPTPTRIPSPPPNPRTESYQDDSENYVTSFQFNKDRLHLEMARILVRDYKDEMIQAMAKEAVRQIFSPSQLPEGMTQEQVMESVREVFQGPKR